MCTNSDCFVNCLELYCLPQLPLAPCDYWALGNGWFTFQNVVYVKYTLDFEDLLWKKNIKYITNHSYIGYMLKWLYFAYIRLSKYIIRISAIFLWVATRKFYTMCLACIGWLWSRFNEVMVKMLCRLNLKVCHVHNHYIMHSKKENYLLGFKTFSLIQPFTSLGSKESFWNALKLVPL